MNKKIRTIIFTAVLMGLTACGSAENKQQETTRPDKPVSIEKTKQILTKENYIAMAQMQYNKVIEAAEHAERHQTQELKKFSLNIPKKNRIEVYSSYKTYQNKKSLDKITISNNDSIISILLSKESSMVSLTLTQSNNVIAQSTMSYQSFIDFLPKTTD